MFEFKNIIVRLANLVESPQGHQFDWNETLPTENKKDGVD